MTGLMTNTQTRKGSLRLWRHLIQVNGESGVFHRACLNLPPCINPSFEECVIREREPFSIQEMPVVTTVITKLFFSEVTPCLMTFPKLEFVKHFSLNIIGLPNSKCKCTW